MCFQWLAYGIMQVYTATCWLTSSYSYKQDSLIFVSPQLSDSKAWYTDLSFHWKVKKASYTISEVILKCDTSSVESVWFLPSCGGWECFHRLFSYCIIRSYLWNLSDQSSHFSWISPLGWILPERWRKKILESKAIRNHGAQCFSRMVHAMAQCMRWL